MTAYLVTKQALGDFYNLVAIPTWFGVDRRTLVYLTLEQKYLLMSLINARLFTLLLNNNSTQMLPLT